MFVGHYSVSYAAKTQAPHVPLWVWFIAVQWLDVVWSILILAGIEKMRIVPGFTEGSAYDLYYMPYTHGLPGAIALSLIFGAIVALATGGARGKTFAWVAAAAFSHWVLDLIVHVPDLPLYDDSAKVGFGLWRHVAVSFPLELILLLAGAWFYARSATFAGARGRGIYWGFIALLGVVQVFGTFGAPPSSPANMAATAPFVYLLLAAVAGAVERVAVRA